MGSRGPKPGSGQKRGGRQKGTPNKATVARQSAVEASGLTPLDFMLLVMRDQSNDLTTRMDAARSAAPYVHPRLSAVSSKIEHDINVRTWLVNAMADALVIDGQALAIGHDHVEDEIPEDF